MNRARILEEIAELDRRINKELANTKVPRLNLKYQSFPAASWVAAAVLFAYWLYGGIIHEGVHDTFGFWAFVLGILTALFALYNTVMFILKGGRKSDNKYAQATSHVQELQAQKMELQKKLKDLDEQ